MTAGEVFNPFRVFRGAFIPNAILELVDLSQSAKLVYGRLSQYAGENGEAWPSMETLGKAVGIGLRQTRGVCAELESYGLIRRVSRSSVGGTLSNGYVFLWHECLEVSKRVDIPQPETADPQTEIAGTPRQEMAGTPRQEAAAKESQEARDSEAREGARSRPFVPPEMTDIVTRMQALVREVQQTFPMFRPEPYILASEFRGHYAKVGWVVRYKGKQPVKMSNWKGAARQWVAKELKWWSEKASGRKKSLDFQPVA